MSKIKTIFASLILSLNFFALPSLTFAATEAGTWNIGAVAGDSKGLKMTESEGTSGTQNVSGGVMHVIDNLVGFFTKTIATLCTLAIIVGGIMMIINAHNESKAAEGKEIITYAIIGLVVCLCAYAIVAIAQSLIYSVA